MDVERLRPALVVLLGVLAVSAAAATMDGSAATNVGSGGEGTGEGEGTGAGSGDGSIGGFNPVGAELQPGLPGWVLEHFFLIVLGLGSLATLAYAAFLVLIGDVEELKRLLTIAGSTLGGAVLYAAALALAALFAWLSRGGDPSIAGAPSEVGGGGTTESAGADPTGTGVPPALLLAGVAVLATVAFAVLVRARRDGAGSAADVDAAADDGDRDRFASAPTRAAGFDDVPASNPVYRAWHRLAAAVKESPERTETPAEVARRAVREGFDHDAVGTLTETFEEVRYGGRPPTKERVERARRALERLDDGGEDA
ncbi:DUF4129 domain-containing protein [Halomicrobium urmianum]|uniref:DUF4129 domain-containing protein n=1 Tax=Halomicrobium urmianum TaxID=1586233 RepID=UPI001CD9673C|nr:DUF4129 domain-containing protein [Halomicrobium urmianum]